VILIVIVYVQMSTHLCLILLLNQRLLRKLTLNFNGFLLKFGLNVCAANINV